MKVAVLYGGTSGEREVSLSSGKGIMEALKKNGHDVIGIDFNPTSLENIINLDVDMAFIGLHGKYGEDGRVQGLLEMLNIPYVGSGVLASALAMDKTKAKQIFNQNGLLTANSKTYNTKTMNELQSIVKDIEEHFSFPCVVKPNQEGSTLGLTIVKDKSQLAGAVETAVSCDSVILVEEFVKGREVTVAVLGEVGQEYALPVIEIIPKNEYYDYESKYTLGGSEHIVPAELEDSVTKSLQKYAVLAHQLLGCKTYSRVDFIVKEDGTSIILEVNTLPGMTPTSLFPDAARAVNMSYEEMIEKFLNLSLQE